MKKFLLLISLFIFSSNVYALTPTPETTLTCSSTANLWNQKVVGGSITSSQGNLLTFKEQASNYTGAIAENYIAVDPSTIYTISSYKPSQVSKITVFFLDTDYKFLSKQDFTKNADINNFTFTTPENSKYITLSFGTSYGMPTFVANIGNTEFIQVAKGELTLTTVDDFEFYEECSVVEPDPDPEPDPEPNPNPIPITLSNKIYVPNINYSCYVVQNEGVIRAYEETPKNNSDINYRDYYINGNYIYRDGTQSFSSYSTLPTCLDNSFITDNVYYRNDFAEILIIFLIMSIFAFYIPLKIFMRLFRRFL